VVLSGANLPPADAGPTERIYRAPSNGLELLVRALLEVGV
jgi:hypothetical protein